MGKPTGFLEFERKEPGYRPRDKRLRDFRAVEIEPDEEEIHDQAARCMDCGIPFCHGYGCPVANVIPEFNDHVYRGEWAEALEILFSTNNFPEFTGRICPASCETACVAGINTDPVAIRQIELAIIEKGFETGLVQPHPPTEYRGIKIAVVGSGPAGLAAADTLNKMGFRVTVFDDAEHPGGLLRYGIPDFKLEKRVVERRVNLMITEGVMFETGIKVGKDVSANYLKKHYNAVLLTCGARQPRDLSIPGRELSGIHFALDYLIQQNKVVSGEQPDPVNRITARGKSVVVIGGGDTGSDCVGTALRQGAKQVVQLEIMPRPPEERAASTPWPMWPLMLRTSHAHKEGGERKWSVTTKEFIGENNAVKRLCCTEVEWRIQDNRHIPVDVEGSEFDVDADLVLLAMGFTGPGNPDLIADFEVETDDRGNVRTDDNQMTSQGGVFAAGDMANGQSLVVRAIHSGRDAAAGILAYFEERKRSKGG